MVMSIDVQFVVSGCPYPLARHADALGYAALLAKNLNTKALMRLVFFSPNAFASILPMRNL
jgi:ABC-type sugar transport system permease subunit